MQQCKGRCLETKSAMQDGSRRSRTKCLTGLSSPMLSSSSVRPNQSSQGNTQHTPSGPVTSTLSRYQSLPSSVWVWLTCNTELRAQSLGLSSNYACVSGALSAPACLGTSRCSVPSGSGSPAVVLPSSNTGFTEQAHTLGPRHLHPVQVPVIARLRLGLAHLQH